MYQESTPCISILIYTNKHDKIKNNCVILENISLLYSAQEFLLYIYCYESVLFAKA